MQHVSQPRSLVQCGTCETPPARRHVGSPSSNCCSPPRCPSGVVQSDGAQPGAKPVGGETEEQSGTGYAAPPGGRRGAATQRHQRSTTVPGGKSNQQLDHRIGRWGRHRAVYGMQEVVSESPQPLRSCRGVGPALRAAACGGRLRPTAPPSAADQPASP